MAGNPYQYFWYSPWGESLEEQYSNTGTYSSPYRFNGKELDPETGNYYYGARYYDPKLSVWLSVDPLVGNNPHLTPYNFSSNNPIVRIDPDGMDDGWVEDECGNTTYDPDVHSQQGLVKQGKSGTYKGEEGVGFNPETGNRVMYNNDGSSFEYSQMLYDVEVDGGKMSDHARNMQNPIVQAIHQGQYDFLRGAFDLNTELIDKVGWGISYVGYGLTLTGIGAEVGVPLAAFGNGVSTVADGMKLSSQLVNRDFKGGIESVGFHLADEAVQFGIDRIPGGALGKEILKQGAHIKMGLAKDIFDYSQNN